MWKDIYFYMMSTYFVVKHFLLSFFRECLVILLLLTMNVFLDDLNNLWLAQHPRITFTCLNYFIPHLLFTTVKGMNVQCLGLLQVTSISVNLLHECISYRIFRNEVLLHNREWSGLVLLWLGGFLHFAIPECGYWEELTKQLSS